MAVRVEIAESALANVAAEPGAKLEVLSEYAGKLIHHSECPHYVDHHLVSPERRASLYPDCIHRHEDLPPSPYGRYGSCRVSKPVYMVTRHAGMVVGTDYSYHGDGEGSYYAIVVTDPVTLATESVYYSSTYGDRGTANVDAPPDLMARYAAACEAKRVAAEEVRYQSEMARRAASIEKGKLVLVVSGRKVPKGLSGKVMYHAPSDYGPRVGFETSNGEVYFTAASNVRVVEGPVMPETVQSKERKAAYFTQKALTRGAR